MFCIPFGKQLWYRNAKCKNLRGRLYMGENAGSSIARLDDWVIPIFCGENSPFSTIISYPLMSRVCLKLCYPASSHGLSSFSPFEPKVPGTPNFQAHPSCLTAYIMSPKSISIELVKSIAHLLLLNYAKFTILRPRSS